MGTMTQVPNFLQKVIDKEHNHYDQFCTKNYNKRRNNEGSSIQYMKLDREKKLWPNRIHDGSIGSFRKESYENLHESHYLHHTENNIFNRKKNEIFDRNIHDFKNKNHIIQDLNPQSNEMVAITNVESARNIHKSNENNFNSHGQDGKRANIFRNSSQVSHSFESIWNRDHTNLNENSPYRTRDHNRQTSKNYNQPEVSILPFEGQVTFNDDNSSHTLSPSQEECRKLFGSPVIFMSEEENKDELFEQDIEPYEDFESQNAFVESIEKEGIQEVNITEITRKKLRKHEIEEYKSNLDILRLSAAIHSLKLVPTSDILNDIISDMCDEVVTESVSSLLPQQVRKFQIKTLLDGLMEEIISEIIVEEKEFVTLTDSDLDHYDSIFNGYRRNEVLISGYAVKMTRDNLLCLDRTSWLNDEVINFYFKLMEDRNKVQQKLYPQLFPKCHFCNTFFYEKLVQTGYNYNGVRRWTRNTDIFQSDKVIFPIHLSVHWTLAVFDVRKKQLEYYDSLCSVHQGRIVLNNLERYILDEHLDKKGVEYQEKIQKVVADHIPQQQNGYDCGVFLCKFANFMSQDLDFTFDQRHMSYFRKRMAVEILRKRLL